MFGSKKKQPAAPAQGMDLRQGMASVQQQKQQMMGGMYGGLDGGAQETSGLLGGGFQQSTGFQGGGPPAQRRKESLLWLNKGAKKSDSDYLWRFQINDNRKCTDVCCLLIFLVFWVGMAAIGYLGFTKGNPTSLILGTDYEGNVCGMDGKNYIYYPELEEDTASMFSLTGNSKDIVLDGVCVKQCPLKGAKIVMRNISHTLRYDTKGLFFRCIDNFKTKQLVVVQCYGWDPPPASSKIGLQEGTCTDYMKDWGASKTPAELLRLVQQNCTASGAFMPVECTLGSDGSDEDCKHQLRQLYPQCTESMTGQAALTEQPPGQNVLYAQLMSYGATMHRMVAEMEKAATPAFIYGAVLAVLLGFMWTLLVQISAPLVVWGTVAACMVTLVAATLIFYAKGGHLGEGFTRKIIAASASIDLNAQDLEPWMAVDESYLTHWRVIAYVSTVVTMVVACAILFFWSRIRTAIAIVTEAAQSMRRIPSIVIFPIFSIAIFIALFLYTVAMAGYLYSMDTVESAPKHFHLVNGTVAVNVQHEFKKWLLSYHVIGFLWTLEVIGGLEMVSISGAIAENYWREKDGKSINGGRAPQSHGCCSSALSRSCGRAVRYHMGSICFGGLILTVVHVVRMLIEYMVNRMKSLEENSCMVRVVGSVLRCLSWLLHEVVSFISDQAYIVIAMQGVSFCAAVQEAYELLKEQVLQLVAVQVVAKFVLLLGKAFIVVTCTVLMFLQLDSGAPLLPFLPGGLAEVLGLPAFEGTQKEPILPSLNGTNSSSSDSSLVFNNLTSAKRRTNHNDVLTDPTMPCILVMLLSYVVASSFLNVFRIAIETIFLCYAADCNMNGNTPTFDLRGRTRVAGDEVVPEGGHAAAKGAQPQAQAQGQTQVHSQAQSQVQAAKGGAPPSFSPPQASPAPPPAPMQQQMGQQVGQQMQQRRPDMDEFDF